MVRLNLFTHVSAIVAAVTGVTVAVAAQEPPLKTLARYDVEYAEPFSCVSGLRELADGRVIVADVKEKTVQLIEMRAGTATRIGQQGQGPAEWMTPNGVFAFPGDTTVLLDPQNQRFLTILPNGTVGKSFTVDLGSNAGRGRGPSTVTATRPQAVDRLGRLYYQGSAFIFTPGAPPVAADSAPIIRYDRRTSKVDTLTWLQLPKSNIQSSGSGNNTSVRITGPNPLAPQRMWTVSPEGRIAIVHADPYQIEWIDGSARSRGPVTQYSRRSVTESDKAPVQSPDCSMTITLGSPEGGGGGGSVRQTVSAVGTSGRSAAPPRDDWPATMPPFAARFGAARVAPTGEVWVPRAHPVNDAPTYDIFDASGKLTGRVGMPKGTRLLGFGNGTVYAYRMDEDDLVYLQRYRLDAAR